MCGCMRVCVWVWVCVAHVSVYVCACSGSSPQLPESPVGSQVNVPRGRLSICLKPSKQKRMHSGKPYHKVVILSCTLHQN